MADVFLNGKFVGTIAQGKALFTKVVEERRKNALPSNLNVQFDSETGNVYIENLKGRLRRPLIVIKNGESALTEKHAEQLDKNEISFSDLVKQGIVEYLDAAEEENSLIAFTPEELTKEHTHLEISPLSMFGLCSSMVPYINHSPAARISMGQKYQKQAIGMYVNNFLLRNDMDVNILHYPQVPIVRSLMNELSKNEEHPAGQNIIVAVMSFKGYNMEDSIIINKGSIDRGFGRSTYYRPAIAEELRYAGGLTDEVAIPDKEVKGYRSEHDYRFLEEDGIIYAEAKVKEDDVVIGKTSPPRFLSGMDEYNLASNVRRESSVSLKHGEEGVVDFVSITESEEGNKLIQVRLRDQRIPEIGDKFASRNGQKGIIGLIVPQSDLPFTSKGVTPDLIFNPQGLPSRMTITYLIELLGAKVGALSGRPIDGTTFNTQDTEEKLRKELMDLGFREDGTETLYNGETGEQYKARIFIGDFYYLKLRHLVANRIQSRARGPIQLLTRQPTEGRAKEGGLRLGEMEKDAFVAHGASLLLKERFDSDRTIVPVCEECGMMAVYNEFKKKSFCSVCGDNVEINNIEISYAFKLMLDELKSLGIYPRIELKDKY